MRELGHTLVVIGAVVIGIGLLMSFGGLSWLGRLPGDIRFESERTRVYIPITSMLLLSALLSLAMYLWQRLRR